MQEYLESPRGTAITNGGPPAALHKLVERIRALYMIKSRNRDPWEAGHTAGYLEALTDAGAFRDCPQVNAVARYKEALQLAGEGNPRCLEILDGLTATQLTARVRGRWTPEQRTFIDHLRKEQRATAAEVLRHIVAWFLGKEQSTVPAAKGVPPSGHFLVKRDTGLKVLDFMTTPSQAAAIKGAAGHLEEAAWLRRAVDLYREHGPLIKVAD